MSTSTLSVVRRRIAWLARINDYFELTKPKIAVLLLVTVAVAGYVASRGQLDPWVLLHTLAGTLLIAGSASAMNQLLERKLDAMMARTADRPLPAGRICPAEVIALGMVGLIGGFVYLTLLVNWLTAFLGLATWFLYVCVYTPLKTRTWLNTAVGAVAGAMPVLMGWSATRSAEALWTDPRAIALFLIVFFWQFPHFMAIAWIYRKQYARAGLKMLPVVDQSGRWAGWHAVLAAFLLIPISVIPGLSISATSLFVMGAVLLGLAQFVCAISFFARTNESTARRLLRASLIYLPALLALMVFVPMI
ncbi:MAG: protoheme IX farnesyltransferase [Planctomycetes bacterium]|nr:protoheme IX farnesyltransferase [Planctomycetota bacterium]